MPALHLIPNTLDLGCEPVPLDHVIPRGVLARAAALRHWVVEDAKTARAFLKRVDALEPLGVPLQALDIRELPRPPKGRPTQADPAAVRPLLAPLEQGHDLGLLSEAGLPGVADPGGALVALAHRGGLAVEVHSGPNSMVLALAASGLQGQSFAFVGYLPQETAARAARLRELQQRSRREEQTQLLIETPYRNEAVMAALLEHLDAGTRVSVACGLSLPGGWCRTHTVAQWRMARPVFTKGWPAVFAFQA